MNIETFSEPADVAYNIFNLRIGNLINGCNAIYNGEWGDINNMKRCLVAKIPASIFNLEKYKKICALSDLYSDYIVQILYKIEGYEHVYVLFKHYNALQVVLQPQVSLAAKQNVFNRLFFMVFQLFEKDPVFQELRVIPEYIRLDANLSPRLLLYPDVTTNQTFSQRYANGNCIRIDLGAIGFYLAKQSLPLRNNKIHYNNHKIMFTSELLFLVDRLLTLEWSREACTTYAKYILNPEEMVGLLKRLDRNCYPRHDPKLNEKRWPEKEDFTDSLKDRRIFASEMYGPRWRTVIDLYDWETLNLSLNRSGTATSTSNRGPETTETLLNLLRHTICHCFKDKELYQSYFETHFPGKDWTYFTIGDFINVILKHYPTFFVRIFDKAFDYLPTHGKIFEY